MPCMDNGPSESELRLASRKNKTAHTDKIIQELKNKLDLATRVACELGRGHTRFGLSKEAIKWLDCHAKEDAKRLLKENALKKLTKEEKEALGF